VGGRAGFQRTKLETLLPVELERLVAFLQRLVDMFESFHAMSAKVVRAFFKTCLGLFQMPDGHSDFGMPLAFA